MKVLILTVGSRGDVQPFVALGKGLKSAGHEVTLCTCERFRSFVADHGLRYGYLGNGILDLIDTGPGRAAMEGVQGIGDAFKTYSELMRLAGPLQTDNLNEMWACTQEAQPDIILFHPKAIGGGAYAEKLGVPAILTALIPMSTPTAAFPAFGFPSLPLGGWYNRFSAHLVGAMNALASKKYVGKWRVNQGLPRRRHATDVRWTPNGAMTPVLYGYSSHVIPRPHDWPESVAVPGYWFLEEENGWSPPANLLEFLEAGPPPVYVGFGSMPGRDAARRTRIVVDALRQANVRGVLAAGWGGLDISDLPDSVYPLKEAPHDWLFPRMAAVVHHGGAGTTASGLRAGRPTVVCPFFGDQPAWGKQVHSLGVGSAPLPQKRLTTESLANAISEVTTSESIVQTARRLGEALRGEDGVAGAVAFVESIASDGRT